LNATGINRGRDAQRPRHIPALGWWDVLMRVKDRLGRDNVSLVSAGLAMYALLSIFPALTAAVFLYGLLGSPEQLIAQLHSFAGTMPLGVWELFQSQLREVASRQHGALSTAAAVSGVVAIWSARSGMASLITATNIAFGEREKRGLIMQFGLSLLFTVGALLSFIVLLVLALAVPLALGLFGLSDGMQTAAAVARWLLLWCFAVSALALVYRYGPSREQARWRWLTVGSVSAATLWLVGSVLFSIYVSTFATYQKSYGALSGVVVLLMWFLLSSFAVVLGAQIDAESERQTRAVRAAIQQESSSLSKV